MNSKELKKYMPFAIAGVLLGLVAFITKQSKNQSSSNSDYQTQQVAQVGQDLNGTFQEQTNEENAQIRSLVDQTNTSMQDMKAYIDQNNQAITQAMQQNNQTVSQHYDQVSQAMTDQFSKLQDEQNKMQQTLATNASMSQAQTSNSLRIASTTNTDMNALSKDENYKYYLEKFSDAAVAGDTTGQMYARDKIQSIAQNYATDKPPTTSTNTSK